MAVLLIPVWALWLCTEPVLRAMGESGEMASDAGYYAGVLSSTLP
eukprot:gene3137-3622_t